MKLVLTAFLVSASLLAAAEPARPKILGVAHAAFYAHDIDKARAYYRDFLGYRDPFAAKSAATFKINDRQYVRLIPEVAPSTDRLSHYGLETNDAEAMRAYLAARGVDVPARVTRSDSGNLVFRVKDPEGHFVEFVQYRPDGREMKGKGKHLPENRISKRMMHVGIIITKLTPARKFYQELLGFEEFWRGSSTGKELSWINLRVPDGDDYIELMLHKEAPAPTARGSAHHICLEVPDIEASLAALEARPYRQSYERPLEFRTGRNRKRQLNVFDPDGTRTELMEPNTVDGVPAASSDAPPPID